MGSLSRKMARKNESDDVRSNKRLAKCFEEVGEKAPARKPVQVARAMVVGLGLLALAGCTTNKSVPPPVASFCDLTVPFRPTEASLAVMSQSEVDDGLAHNLRGELLCGWKA